MMQPHDSLLSQAYHEAAHPEPSTALDARILAAARQAVVPQRRRPAWFGWAVPLSTMAVLVLGIGLLFRMQLEAPETLREDMPPLPALESNASRESGLDAGPDAAPAAQAKLEVQVKRTPPAPIQPTVPSVAATPPETAANKTVQAPAASAPVAAEVAAAIAPIIEAMPAPMSPTRPSSVADSAAVPAPAASAGTSMAKESAIRAERDAAARSVSTNASPASAARLKQGMSRMQAAEPMQESPEQWVESIRKLLREGQIEAARNRLRDLRKRYPDFSLPPDLEPARCCPLPADSAE